MICKQCQKNKIKNIIKDADKALERFYKKYTKKKK